MKKEELFEILGDLDEEEIAKAGSYDQSKGSAAEGSGWKESAAKESGAKGSGWKESAAKESGAKGSDGKGSGTQGAQGGRKLRRSWAIFGAVAAVLALALFVKLLWPKEPGGDDREGIEVAGMKASESPEVMSSEGISATQGGEGNESIGSGEDPGQEETDPDGDAWELASKWMGWTEEDAGWLKKVKVVNVSLPEPLTEKEYIYGLEYLTEEHAYFATCRTEASQLKGSMQGFYESVTKSLLAEGEGNAVCSPLNIYLALSVLAETTDGNSRKEILDFLGADSIETLRKSAGNLWNSNYMDSRVVTSILANSIWLNEAESFRWDTLEMLAKEYYVSSFVGQPGSEEMDQGLQSWTNKATGGLLEEYVRDIHLTPSTVFDLISTLYYHATWGEGFDEEKTTEETFHGTKGDTSVEMMHKSKMAEVYTSEKVTAIRMPLYGGGWTYFYLPAEGIDVASLAGDPELLAIERLYENQEGWSRPLVRLSLPRFQVKQKTDLLPLLASWGIKDVLDGSASDFSPVMEDPEDQISLGKAEHAATFMIDENGVTGAAYVELRAQRSAQRAEDEIDLVFDRPFLFAVYSEDGSILFEGIVRDIE